MITRNQLIDHLLANGYIQHGESYAIDNVIFRLGEHDFYVIIESPKLPGSFKTPPYSKVRYTYDASTFMDGDLWLDHWK